ncbi:helix-turn-helix domain-containing protein [Fulvivirgaceae bacterium BMA12]|uniref:Helix-turn-helix domain-containing protein n=1 Tax=Agaribacillus aureus TaxID=3051825 RepID=A0ABT8L574_9BACT|nr:helix-turn-helix domain-containing protein [Fulvivirgaceae bacterium BMA12]
MADKILTIWLLVVFVQIAANYLEFTGYYDKFPHLVGSTSSLIFLYGPLLYFYVKTSISPQARFRPGYLFHFIPFLLYNALLLPFYLLKSSEKLIYYNEVIKGDSSAILSLALICKTITLPVYLIWVFILLRAHQREVQKYFSDTENVDLKWLKFLVGSLFILSLVVLAATTMKLGMEITLETESYIFAAASIWVFALGYYGLKQTPIFTSIPSKVETPGVEKPKIRYEKNRLTEADAIRYEDLLIDYMEKEKPFLQHKVTLQEVASALQIPTHHLSQVLNDKINQNFFDFINSYRIKTLKGKLNDPANKHLTILGIALDSGFNSKASFNRVFKKHTGHTPSEYLKMNK